VELTMNPGGSPKATHADVRQFRANVTRVRSVRRGLPLEAIAQCLAVPLAFRHALNGVSYYGRAVRARDGVSLARQFTYLVADYFYRIRPDDFYMYQLHVAVNRQKRDRHFAFSQVLAMQQYLIEAASSADYPLLRSKFMFAAKCAELALPTVPIMAEFVGGDVRLKSSGLPDVDLFSKPAEPDARSRHQSLAMEIPRGLLGRCHR
jgi:hypothetical protein